MISEIKLLELFAGSRSIGKETETSKSLSFLNVLKDYYRDNFYFPEDTNAIIKIMIKYGYNFKSMKEATNLIYK